MWTCPSCGAEVDDGFEVCWGCGSTPEGDVDPGFHAETEGIITEQEFQAEQAARAQENLVTLATFWSVPEAHMLRSRLEAEGVHAVVADELSTAMTWGTLNSQGGIKVQVAERDLTRAREVLDDSPAAFGRDEDQDEDEEGK
jgi:hypothetical protein